MDEDSDMVVEDDECENEVDVHRSLDQMQNLVRAVKTKQSIEKYVSRIKSTKYVNTLD